MGQRGPCLQVLEATFTLRPPRNGGGDRRAEVKMVTQQYSVALGNTAWAGVGDGHLGSAPAGPGEVTGHHIGLETLLRG